ncbi:hypothetical protein R84B8_02022 [Treponema sp. R8-4-B8]
MPVIRKKTDLLNNLEELIGKLELYHSLQMGLDQINNGEFIEEE